MKRFSLALLAMMALTMPALAERAYVCSNQVKIVDTDAAGVVGTIDLGKSMVRDMAVTADGSTAYVAHSRGIAVVDVATSAVRETWSDRAVNDIVLDEAGGALHTLQHRSGGAYEMVAYDLTTGAELRRFEVDHKALDLAMPAGADRIYTANIHLGTVNPYHRISGEAQESISVSASASEAEHGTYIIKSLLSADGRSVYVVLNGELAGIQVIDGLTGALTRTIRLGHAAYVRDAVISPDGTRAYLSCIDHVAVVDLVEGREAAWAPLDLPHQGLGITSDGGHLFVANPVYDENGGSVTVMDTASLEIVQRIAVPEISPYTVAVLP